MSKKTKWLGAGAVAFVIVLAVVLITRGDDSGSSVQLAPPLEPQTPGPLPTGQASPPDRPADAGPAVQLLPDGGAVPTASEPPKSTRFPQPPDPAKYRPARYLVYSDDDVSMRKSDDNRNWAVSRIIEVVQATPAQANQIHELWHIHEDGRRELYNQAADRASGPRLLNLEAERRLDVEFESALLGKVLDPEQGQRMLEEVPPTGIQLPTKVRTF
jgi:hypothetical protein